LRNTLQSNLRLASNNVLPSLLCIQSHLSCLEVQGVPEQGRSVCKSTADSNINSLYFTVTAKMDVYANSYTVYPTEILKHSTSKEKCKNMERNSLQ